MIVVDIETIVDSMPYGANFAEMIILGMKKNPFSAGQTNAVAMKNTSTFGNPMLSVHPDAKATMIR